MIIAVLLLTFGTFGSVELMIQLPFKQLFHRMLRVGRLAIATVRSNSLGDRRKELVFRAIATQTLWLTLSYCGMVLLVLTPAVAAFFGGQTLSLPVEDCLISLPFHALLLMLTLIYARGRDAIISPTLRTA